MTEKPRYRVQARGSYCIVGRQARSARKSLGLSRADMQFAASLLPLQVIAVESGYGLLDEKEAVRRALERHGVYFRAFCSTPSFSIGHPHREITAQAVAETIQI